MGRVSQETIEKLNNFICSLPEEAKGKCALCNQTLVHIVKQAEAQTGAGTATVTRAIADKINENSAPQDMVTAGSLRHKVISNETGRHNSISALRTNRIEKLEIDRETIIVNDNNRFEKLEEETNNEIIKIAKKINKEKAEKKREEIIRTLDSVETKNIKTVKGVFDVVVIDPPWPITKIKRDCRPNQVELDYSIMGIPEIEALKIPCADNCHIWLWTTHKFLPNAFSCLVEWGLKYVCCFTWHKPGGFQPVGLPQYNSEFCLYARKGTPVFIETKAFPVCFNAGRGIHSEKPKEFYDIVRRVTAGRRLDMFNRREIKGFETYGDEAI